jgi:hypothetical protein
MIVQTTTPVTHEDALPTLKRLKDLPGFVYGYMTERAGQLELVTLFKCRNGQPHESQRRVLEIRANPAGIMAVRAGLNLDELTPDMFRDTPTEELKPGVFFNPATNTGMIVCGPLIDPR